MCDECQSFFDSCPDREPMVQYLVRYINSFKGLHTLDSCEGHLEVERTYLQPTRHTVTLSCTPHVFIRCDYGEESVFGTMELFDWRLRQQYLMMDNDFFLFPDTGAFDIYTPPTEAQRRDIRRAQLQLDLWRLLLELRKEDRT